jgi:hypothetical protein
MRAGSVPVTSETRSRTVPQVLSPPPQRPDALTWYNALRPADLGMYRA